MAPPVRTGSLLPERRRTARLEPMAARHVGKSRVSTQADSVMNPCALEVPEPGEATGVMADKATAMAVTVNVDLRTAVSQSGSGRTEVAGGTASSERASPGPAAPRAQTVRPAQELVTSNPGSHRRSCADAHSGRIRHRIRGRCVRSK